MSLLTDLINLTLNLTLNLLLLPYHLALYLAHSLLFLPLSLLSWTFYLTSPAAVPILILFCLLFLLPCAIWLVLFLAHNLVNLARLTVRLLLLPFELLWEPFGWLIGVVTESAREARLRTGRGARRARRGPWLAAGSAKRASLWVEGRNDDYDGDNNNNNQGGYTYGGWGSSQVEDPLRGPGARERYLARQRARYSSI
ncbi:hypothetical protein QBC41DRAFT_374012 [Cercophora samala]|uniref:Uncharacterized protein n=1 Tax=Cercophora samala TaxID=330535 RepID=A0AA39ZCE0_9PEZI|nr:hypothetical protein QBC41DRAFT_374012 [Cercophora samala]